MKLQLVGEMVCSSFIYGEVLELDERGVVCIIKLFFSELMGKCMCF